jgi:hypothetical protein
MTTSESIDARIEFEREHRDPTDLELEPVTSEDQDYESAPPDYLISSYPADFTLEVLHQKWKAEEIRIPEFQRAFVWKQVQASKLIESFLVGLPVPPVFVFTERKSQYWFVIDGQQRLKSIFYFFEGYFGEGSQGQRRVFRLTGLSPESRFNEKTYEELREEDQRRLKNAVLRSIVVQQLDPGDDTSMFHIFERLNTGGTLPTNQEIRNCVYHGAFVEFLAKLNQLPDWRKILGKDLPDTRKKDVELLVRFFAMRDISAYQKPMKDFLSKFMKKNSNASRESLEQSSEIFKETCGQLLKALGDRPFHVRAGLNVAVADAVMVAFSNHIGEVPADITKRYQELKEDEKFQSNTRQGTTDVDTVRERFAQAEKVLFK